MNKNMQQYLDKAEVLIEALPYIQRFNRKDHRCEIRRKRYDRRRIEKARY